MKRIPTACTVVALAAALTLTGCFSESLSGGGDGIHRFHRDDRHDNGSHHDGGSPLCSPIPFRVLTTAGPSPCSIP